MNKEDIKVGETYNVRVKVNGFNYAKNAATVWDCGGHPCYFLLEDFSPISPETTPKYDPNRMFRKGDKVKPRERNGRIPWAKDMTLTVVNDESTAGVTVRDEETGEERLMCVLFLKLVTPVEELEPYSVEEDKWYWHVLEEQNSGKITVCKFCKDFHPHAKEAAEAERDRLNAEWRKEQGK